MIMDQSKRHHWWPEGVSERWLDAKGVVHEMAPDGTEKPLTPKNAGVIGHGHSIKMHSDPNVQSAWDENFEGKFQDVDSHFPRLLDWLDEVRAASVASSSGASTTFVPLAVSEDRLEWLSKGLISLAVRSPRCRAMAVGLADRLRGPIPTRERNRLIGLNLRDTFERAVENIGTQGKFVIILSPEREFIYGDGFFHNVQPPMATSISPTILAPLLPHVSVLFVRPIQFSVEPKVHTFIASERDVEALNQTVMVYSCDRVFYRHHRPELTDDFKKGRHLVYNGENPISNFIKHIPGFRSALPWT
jgi:hypothetical protein